jgi:hypothetical protein
VSSAPNKQQARKYPSADVKMLFALAAGLCAFPDCRARCIVDSTDYDEAKVIGKIAHIVAHGDEGPRADRSVSLDQRDCYDNWLLLCPTHHDTVDVQPNTYSVIILREWKSSHEGWVRSTLSAAMPVISFVELRQVTNALVASASANAIDLKLIPPAEKMEKNKLTSAVRAHLTLGVAKSKEVAKFVDHFARIDTTFPDRLRAGFQAKYNEYRASITTLSY